MGMTGLGGGILLLPLLIVVLRVPAMIAIGSGTAFAAITKTGAASYLLESQTSGLGIGRLSGLRQRARRSARHRSSGISSFELRR